MYRYSSGFAGEVVSHESAVVENASFICRSVYLPHEVPHALALHIEIYTASRGFPATAQVLCRKSYSCRQKYFFGETVCVHTTNLQLVSIQCHWFLQSNGKIVNSQLLHGPLFVLASDQMMMIV